MSRVDGSGCFRPVLRRGSGRLFRVLLSDDVSGPGDNIVDAIQVGKAALVVHPRGQVEIETIRPTIEAHSPEIVFWRVAPEEAQGGLFGEHAAGFKR